MDHQPLQRFVEAQDQGRRLRTGAGRAVKLRASMMLFARAVQPPSLRKPGHIAGFRRLGDLEVFTGVLDRYFGEPDEATLRLR